MSVFKIMEKANHLAVHGLFDSRERAERHLSEVIPGYVAKSYFMDKMLTADSFEIVSGRFAKDAQPIEIRPGSFSSTLA